MYRRLMAVGEQVAKAVEAVLGGAGAADCSREGADFESLVRAVLLETGSLDLNSLIERVAGEAMRIETARGAWVTDVALWGPDLFRREATAAVRRMIGRSLALESEGAPIAIPVLSPQ